MTATDDLLQRAAARARGFDGRGIDGRPGLRIAIVTCMDARIDVHALLGLAAGEAHVLRNAGGVVTDDMIRSLAISQRLLGTEEIMLIHHTTCGMLTVTDEEFGRAIENETGVAPPWRAGAFADLEDDVRESIARVRSSPFLPARERVRGFVYDVQTGELAEIV